MALNTSGKFQIGREVEAWRPKTMILSEATKEAIAELNSVKSWADLRDLCEQQRIKRERGGR
jgi:hypothetical protein